MKDPAGWFDRFLYYVIATCYPKMERRLGHPTMSLPYINSLKGVAIVPFNESLREEPTIREIASDRSFLSFVPGLIDHLHTPIPHIHEQVKLAAADQDFQLYDKNTCQEFHFLFLELLKRFQTSLKELTNSQNDNGQFTKYVLQALLMGDALRRMAKGAALRMHLRTIEAKLVDHRRPDMSMPMPGGNAAKDEEQGEKQDEPDEELEAVQPSALSMEKNVPVPVPLWKSYRNWLNLMVIHFDAVYILFHHISKPAFDKHRMISLKVLVAPPTDKALLPWRQLFTDSKLFPTENEADSSSSTTNDEILKFLNDAASPDMKKCFSLIQAVKSSWKQKKKDVTIQHLAKFISFDSETSDWHSSASKLAATINDYYAKTPSSDELFDKITNTIQSLHDAAIFYLFLSKKDFSNEFSGTLHCEACLTSLLSAADSDNDITIDSKHKDVLEEMKVRYVVSRWFYQQLITSDDRIVDELLAYQNVAARHVDTFSRS
jgi:hypothetical protein